MSPLYLPRLLAQATLRLAFKDVPLQQWLTPYGSNCVKLNCEVVGERPWVITYEVNGVPLDPQTRSDATALSDGKTAENRIVKMTGTGHVCIMDEIRLVAMNSFISVYIILNYFVKMDGIFLPILQCQEMAVFLFLEVHSMLD